MNTKEQLLQQAQELLKAAKENPQEFEGLTKKYMGFKAVEHSAKESGARDPGAVAAAAGRAKYGKEAFQHAAATGHKMGKDEMTEHEKHTAENQRKADLRDKKIKKSDVPKEQQGGQISAEPTPAHGMKKGDVPTDVQGGAISSEPTPAHGMKKDAMNPAAKPDPAKPQPEKPGAQPQPQHAADAGGTEHIHHALKICDTPEKQKQLLAHLKSVHEAPAAQPGAPAAKAAPAAAPAMKAEDILAQAKILLKAAKDDPKQFEELTKAFGAPAPAGAPAAPKPAGMPKPAGAKPPGMGQPAMPKPAGVIKAPSMRMSKEEIKADLAKPWSPKHMKQG